MKDAHQPDTAASALFCLGLLSRIHGNPLSMDQLRHQFCLDHTRVDPLEMARMIAEIGIRAKPVRKRPDALAPSLFPVVAQQTDGSFCILAGRDPDKGQILIQRPDMPRGQWMSDNDLASSLTGKIILLTRLGQDRGSERRFGLGWFLRAALKYRSVLRDCLLASFFVQVFGLITPLVFRVIIDKVLGNHSLSTLDVLVFGLVMVAFFELALNTMRTYLMTHTASRIDLLLGLDLFEHLTRLPLSYFESRQVGDTIARMKEVENVRRFITGSGLMLVLDLFFVLVFLGTMFLFSPLLTLIVLAALPVLFGVSFILTPLLRRRLEDRFTSHARNQSFLVETLSGMETIKVNAAEPRLRQRWEEQLSEHARISFASSHLTNLISQSTTIISRILTVLLLWFGAREVLAGSLTVGQFIAFNMLSSRVIAPVLRLSRIWEEFQQARISISRIRDIFSTPTEPGFNPGRVSLPRIKGQVRFEDVCFRYHPHGPVVLHRISFSVQPGEVIGIVGPTGSGKTTLIKLLQRLYVPEQGRILIDGIDLAQADTSWLRRQIGVVNQDGILLNTSIRDNIALNGPGLSMEAIIHAATLAGAHEFILSLPEGYDTVVGERGCRLSAGQRQRLALARALAGNPAMLILDEATSSLDYESERKVQENMREICAGRTVFIVAHRLSTIRHADRIITLDRGRITETGSPASLRGSGGLFDQFSAIHEGSYA